MTRLAGCTLEELRDRYRHDLFDDFLPFMDRHVIDPEYGGFRCWTDRDGANLNQDKTTWFEGRGIWVYSFLYNHFGHDGRYLEVARHSLDFILKARPPRGTMWPRSFTRDGRPLTPPSPDVYGDLFVAEGLAEFSAAAGEPQYWEIAKEILADCVRLYDRADYDPAIGQTYLGPDAPPFPGARIQGAWMVLLRLATQMLRRSDDPAIEAVAARSVEAVMNHHYHPGFQLNNELLNHDLSRPQGRYAALVYTGHAIETLWMIMDEAMRIGDQALFDRAAERFRRHVEVAWDDVYGGVFRGLLDVDENVFTLDKVLWAQEEVLVGALLAIEHTGAAWACHIFEKMYAYVQDHFPLQKHGFPLWISQADRKVTFERHANRVENYHHPRHLMINLLALDRMIALRAQQPLPQRASGDYQ